MAISAVTTVRRRKNGQDAIVYTLEVSPTIIRYDSAGKPNNTTVLVKLKKKVGSKDAEYCSDHYLCVKKMKGNAEIETLGPVITGTMQFKVLDIADRYVIFALDASTVIVQTEVTTVHDGKNGSDGNDGNDGNDGTDGEDAVSYDLRTSVEVINCSSLGIPKIETFQVSIYKTIGNGIPQLCTSGTYLKVACQPTSGIGSIFRTQQGTMTISTSRGGVIPTYFKSFVISAGITVDGNELGEKLIMTTVDGITGPAGNRGQLPYPFGKWDASVTYTATNNVTPFVFYEPGNTYYVINKTGSFKGINPASDYAANGKNATWIPFENYKTIFAELLMANLGIIAGSVFWDNKLFSQYGTDIYGNPITSEGAYRGIVDGSFKPNLLIDWLTGFLKCNNVDITGTINATDGKFKGSIAENCKNLPTGREEILLDFSTGFNFSGSVGRTNSTLVLPTGIEYEGVRCSITNLGERGGGNYIVKMDNNSSFRLNTGYSGTKISLGGSGMLELKAISVGSSVVWWILNPDSFSLSPWSDTFAQAEPYVEKEGSGKIYYRDGRGWMLSGRIHSGILSFERMSIGRFKLSFSNTLDAGSYSVLITCEDTSNSGYGCVREKTNGYFIVETLQGSTLKDIAFAFLILK